MRPEENFAALIRRRYSLANTFNVAEFGRTVADLEFDELPNKLDGLLLRRRGHNPLILVSASISTSRQVFTIAHELGHLFIPWHVNSLYTDTAYDIGEYGHVSPHSVYEAQANRFASEFLMPSNFVKEILDANTSTANIIDRLKMMGVSSAAANVRIVSISDEPLVCCEVNRRNITISVRRSKNVRARTPEVGQIVDEHLYPNSQFYLDDSGANRFMWWKLTAEDNDGRVPLILKADRTSKSILDEILDDYGIGYNEERAALHKSFSGSSGGVKSSYMQNHSRGTPFDKRERLSGNISHHENLHIIARHRLFDILIDTAVIEMNLKY